MLNASLLGDKGHRSKLENLVRDLHVDTSFLPFHEVNNAIRCGELKGMFQYIEKIEMKM